MKILDIKLPFNLLILNEGINKEILSINDVINFLNNDIELVSAHEGFIVELNFLEGKEEFVEKVRRFLLQIYNINFLSFTSTIEEFYSYHGLLKIKNTDLDIEEKLYKIGHYWADVNYPSEWEPFILYMPGEIKSIKSIYETFENFMRDQKENISFCVKYKINMPYYNNPDNG